MNKEESREAMKLLLSHLASDHQDKAQGIRGCKLIPGNRSITPKSVKMYRIKEQNRVTYNMTTVVVKHTYPANIYYSDSLSGFLSGDDILEDATTNMRQILDTELNAPDPSNSWDLDVVHDIFYRQGKLHIACQSKHVGKLLTTRLTEFLELLIKATTEGFWGAYAKPPKICKSLLHNRKAKYWKASGAVQCTPEVSSAQYLH